MRPAEHLLIHEQVLMMYELRGRYNAAVIFKPVWCRHTATGSRKVENHIFVTGSLRNNYLRIIRARIGGNFRFSP